MAQSPFPGMDPYLESPDLWPDVHSSLQFVFREQLTPLLAPKYVAELHTQVVIDRFADDPPESGLAMPDVAVVQPQGPGGGTRLAAVVVPAPLRLRVPMPVPTRLVSVYIRRREDERLVTVIELLSPINKRPGEGRQEYLEKRAAFLETGVHLVEIDLLRRWPRMPLEGVLPECEYLVMLSNAYERPECDVWPITLRQALPTLDIPLMRPDPPVPLDLGQALRTAYGRALYGLRIDYTAPPLPPLSPADVAWAAALMPPSS